MKKVFLRTAAIASIAAAAFMAGPAQAADGTLTITGKIKSLTCTIGVTGDSDVTSGVGNLITVPLGTFSTGTANLGGTGSYLGGKNFMVNLTGCTAPDSGKGLTLSFDTSSPNIDSSSGHLKNSLTTGAALNLVAVVRATVGGTPPTGGAAGTTPIDFRAGPGSNNMPKGTNGANTAAFNFLVQFRTTGTVTAGDFQTSIPFAVDMK
uniref:fimbrial protein n=1 Tax=Propionivibrio sp. TaxID=2212460 RepID=UPI0039E39118